MSRHKPPRRLDLKFRVRPLVRMPKSVMFGKLKEFVSSGVAPGDLEVAYMEYSHSKGRIFQPGQRIQEGEREELHKFYNVLLSIDPDKEVSIEPKRGRYAANPTTRIGEPDS